jgi:hypothetical protein
MPSRQLHVNFKPSISPHSVGFDTSTSPRLKSLNFKTPSTINLLVQAEKITSGGVSFLDLTRQHVQERGGIAYTMDSNSNTCWFMFSFYTILCVLNTCFLDVYETSRFGAPTRAQESSWATFPHPGEDIGLAV